MIELTCCDISQFQVPVDDSYPHRWLIFRAFDGEYTDINYAHNLAWAQRAVKSGVTLGFTVYFVWEPGYNHIARLNQMGVPTDCHLMIDVESWGNRVAGDHSSELNALVEACRARQGSPDLVWGYANRVDLGSLWPTHPNVSFVIASYGGPQPTVPNLVGWQYTDGQYIVPGLPSRTAPFGQCDHNVLYLPDSLEDDLSAADVQAINDHTDKMVNLVRFGDGPDVPASSNTHPDNLKQIKGAIAGVAAQVAALQSVITQSAGGGVDLAKVQAAAQAGAAAALSDLHLTATIASA